MFVSEIFESFHGEVNGHHQGRIVTFIRLSGCNLRCSYCDTKETWNDFYGENLTPKQILTKVLRLKHKYICLTGGEPLLDDEGQLIELMKLLIGHGHRISVETNGTIDITPYVQFVDSFVIDYKIECDIPFSESNLLNIRKTDIIKFVVGDVGEFNLACRIKDYIEINFPSNVQFAFSPLMPKMSPQSLAKLMLSSKEDNCILSVQLHKILDFK